MVSISGKSKTWRLYFIYPDDSVVGLQKYKELKNMFDVLEGFKWKDVTPLHKMQLSFNYPLHHGEILDLVDYFIIPTHQGLSPLTLSSFLEKVPDRRKYLYIDPSLGNIWANTQVPIDQIETFMKEHRETVTRISVQNPFPGSIKDYRLNRLFLQAGSIPEGTMLAGSIHFDDINALQQIKKALEERSIFYNFSGCEAFLEFEIHNNQPVEVLDSIYKTMFGEYIEDFEITTDVKHHEGAEEMIRLDFVLRFGKG